MKISLINPLICVFFLSLFLSAGLGTAAAAEEYLVTDLGTLGGSWSRAGAMNGEGQVVGSSTIPNSAMHGFLWQNGIMVDLGTPQGFLVSSAAGLNDSGRVVANAEGSYQSQYAFLWDNGVWTDLGSLPNLDYSAATDINNANQVVGYSFMLGPGGGFRAWLWEGGGLSDLGTLGGEDSLAASVNELGQVVGWAETVDPAITHAFIWTNGVMTDLGVLPGETDSSASDLNEVGQVCGNSAHTLQTYPFSTYRTACLWDNGQVIDIGKLPGYTRNSSASGINGEGKVVGYSTDYGNKSHAFIWEDGELTDLNDLIDPGLGWELETAADITESGQIVGYGKHGGEMRAYLLEPAAMEPIPDIKIDGQDGPLNIPSYQAISMTISLDPGSQAGIRHDWWILAERSGGSTFSRIWPGTWIPGIHRAYDGSLIAVNDFNVYSGTIPAGTWLFAFSVDELNNIYEGTHLDTITVTSF